MVEHADITNLKSPVVGDIHSTVPLVVPSLGTHLTRVKLHIPRWRLYMRPTIHAGS